MEFDKLWERWEADYWKALATKDPIYEPAFHNAMVRLVARIISPTPLYQVSNGHRVKV